MSYRSDFPPLGLKGWFTGTHKVLEFEIFANDGIAPDLPTGLPNPNKTMVDVSAWDLAWTLALVEGGPALITKRTSGSGITITGTYNASRTVNTQRVLVAIDDEDTEPLAADIYWHALKRMNADAEDIVSWGSVTLKASAAPSA